MPPQPGAERLCIQCAGLMSNDVTLLEQHQGWNTSDVVASGQFRLNFSIHLEKPDIWFEFGANALIDRRHNFAGPAPLRPEVDQHWNVVALDVDFEAFGRDRNRPPIEKSLVALAAFRPARVFPARNTVHTIAMRTNDVPDFFAHDSLSQKLTLNAWPGAACGWAAETHDRDRQDLRLP